MTASSKPASQRLRRFSRAQRAVHRAIAVLMTVCIVSAAVLYNGALALRVGHRHIVVLVHVYSGFALLVPLVAGVLSAAYRADLRILNRFNRSDWRWLRSKEYRRGTPRVGKFNAGQKLNAALSSGAILVLLGTGTLMYFPDLVRLSWRTGATFVHDWFALAVGTLVIGHIGYAIKDPEARRGMRTGTVSTAWAHAEHPDWAVELRDAQDPSDPEPSAR